MEGILNIYIKEVSNVSLENNNFYSKWKSKLTEAENLIGNLNERVVELKRDYEREKNRNRELIEAKKISWYYIFKCYSTVQELRSLFCNKKTSSRYILKSLKLNTASRVFDVASSIISRARSSADITVLSFRWKKQILRGPRVNVKLIQSFWLEVRIVPLVVEGQLELESSLLLK